ncbi:cytochrome P450, partial [Neobacillus niacini]|uniref:cytochrome P450 n=1 Tax=Neobacillus niacini TaxID=86668 RepID=UPI0030026534
LVKDPYPIYKLLRDEEPVSFVESMNMWIVSRFEDIRDMEKQSELFSASEDMPMTIKLFGGEQMVTADGEYHKKLRGAAEAFLRPKEVKNRWSDLIRKDGEELIARQYHRGEMDIVTDFAGPLAARALKHLLGLPHVSDDDMQFWSKSYIDAFQYNRDNSEIKRNLNLTNHQIDEIVKEEIEKLKNNPDETVISTMVQGGLTISEISGNVKLMISGGLNEPRDAVACAIWALLQFSNQLELVNADPSLYKNVAEESVRWLSPIGFLRRTAMSDVTINGVMIKKGDRVGAAIASGNRDERRWEDPDKFDITRKKIQSHLAYGTGSHYCLGAWVARAQIMISVPLVFEQLKNLRVDQNNPAEIWGFTFRGLTKCGVKWDV